MEIAMIEQDTIKLLRECDAGIKMGVESIDDVLDYAHSAELKKSLSHCKEQHQKLKEEIDSELHRYHDEGKNPRPIAEGMSTMKTGMKLAMNDSDHTIAGLRGEN